MLLLLAGLATPAGAAVKVFFPRGEQVVAVPRPGSTAEDAVRALLRGPTPAERRLGFRTYIPKGTSLRSVTVAGGRATVNLGPWSMQGTNGEGLNARLVQLVYTATGAPGVRSAHVFIAGGTVLGVFPGIDASIPLTRESRRPRPPCRRRSARAPGPPRRRSPRCRRGSPRSASCPPTRSTGAWAPAPRRG